jgi:hypothetical protein
MDTENQDIWQNLALTSVGGLLSSTVLILLTLPALYYLSVRLGWGFRRLGAWRSGSAIIAFLLAAAAVLARFVEIEAVARVTVDLGVDTLGRIAERIGPITVGRFMLLFGALVVIAGAIPRLERWRPARFVMAANELVLAVLLAASAVGAYRLFEGWPRRIALAIYAILAGWLVMSSVFGYLRRRTAEHPAAVGGPDAPAAT